MNYKDFTELIRLGQSIGLSTLKELFEFGAQHGAKNKIELLTALRTEYRMRLNRALGLK